MIALSPSAGLLTTLGDTKRCRGRPRADFLGSRESLFAGAGYWPRKERSEEGIVLLRQGLAANRDVGAKVTQAYFMAALTGAYGKMGQVKEGLAVVAEALELVSKAGERFYEAELYRLKGELALKQSEVQGPESEVHKAAETCYLRAIETARQQQAKSLELRATTSLARLLAKQGRRGEARAMLAEIYNWFTEGFDAADLMEAKALLGHLSASPMLRVHAFSMAHEAKKGLPTPFYPPCLGLPPVIVTTSLTDSQCIRNPVFSRNQPPSGPAVAISTKPRSISLNPKINQAARWYATRS